jgi:hypothetical protein
MFRHEPLSPLPRLRESLLEIGDAIIVAAALDDFDLWVGFLGRTFTTSSDEMPRVEAAMARPIPANRVLSALGLRLTCLMTDGFATRVVARPDVRMPFPSRAAAPDLAFLALLRNFFTFRRIATPHLQARLDLAKFVTLEPR